ncbi:hypothetical protein [Pseudarthrobacter phenanthrenivorans]|uniref:DUF3854 domain-containing protein n=1 Tax=Pseudarthrobacter phenanthrenivorans TaxID=361575 RepID=A0A0B4DWD9_PSEPS|nr:hypothetical protein [Pseudarthrobacter phenanthrenivorans]KIC68740.1 hypothetical protein RM50_04625 [Pseudarthrobacter phenanthrenivorans]
MSASTIDLESVIEAAAQAPVQEVTTTVEAVAEKAVSRYLSEEHKAFFAARAIHPDHAQAYTVTDVDGLPEELQFHAKKHGDVIFPGLVFEHVDIRGNVTNQYRPDLKPEDVGVAKEDGWGKYLFAKGASNGPFVHRLQMHMVGKAKRTAVIEGTAQLRAAISQAVAGGYIDEVLFVGIPGCTGSVKDGKFSQDWDLLLMDSEQMENPKDSDTVIIFDKDVASNPNVYRAAKLLVAHLKTCTGGKVRVADVPAYSKTGGLDDYLASQLPSSRSLKLLRLMQDATTKLPPRPAVTAQQRAGENDMPVMDFTEGVTAFPPTQVGSTKLPGRILMHAAARIVRSYAEFNDLRPEMIQVMRYDLEVTTKVHGVPQAYLVEGLSTAELENPRRWLDRLPSGVGANLSVFTKDIEMITRVIRNVSTQELVDVVKRTGLKVDKDGVTRFMDTEGAIGPEDKITHLRAKVSEETMSGFVLPDPHQIDEETKRAAFRHVFDMWDICVDPTAFLLPLGQAITAIHGVKPKGTYGSVGAKGSGKTTIMDMARSLLGSKISMANFEASPGAVGQLGAGCHMVPLFVDDFQDLSAGGRTAIENGVKAINMLLRRGYGGADYARSRLVQNKDTGEWNPEKADPSSPFFSITMERKAIPYGAESSMDRLLLASVTKANSFASSEDAHVAMRHAKNPLGNLAYSLAVLEVVKGVALFHTGDGLYPVNGGQAQLDHWIEFHETMRQQVQVGLQIDFPGIEDDRRYEVAATPVMGIELFLTLAFEEGAISSEEYKTRVQQSRELIMKAAFAWQNDVIRRGGGAEGQLAKLADATASGSCMIADNWKAAYIPADGIRVKLLGWYHTYLGENVVVLIPSEAAKICGTTVERLEQDLIQHLVLDSKGNRKPSVPSKATPSGKQRLWALRLAAFEGENQDFDPAEHSDMEVHTDF